MSNINTGGPAFPVTLRNSTDVEMTDPYGDALPPHADRQFFGLTVRDYFAAKAMATLIQGAVLPTKADRDEWLPKLSELSYDVADHMLKAREGA